MVSMCLPSDALSQYLPSYLVSLTLDVGYLFTAAPAKCSRCSLPSTRGISPLPPLLTLNVEIEENNRMGKTRDLFKKIRDKKGTFHAKRGSIKDRDGMDLTEAEDTKKRWQEYTEELYKKDLHDTDNHNGVITDLEPDILECEVKWALESITRNKASGGMEFQLSYFKS